MQFRILKKSKKSRARLGVIKTPHGILHTPAFLPVATQATVKTLTSQDLKEIGFEGILCNAYHLMLRPGSALIKKMGGLHSFMSFQGVIVTDSGGFQVFSLGKGFEQNVGKFVNAQTQSYPQEVRPRSDLGLTLSRVRVREEGVYFKSHIDGSEEFLSPEKAVKIQEDLNSDIALVLDECASPLDNYDYAKKALERTNRWAVRCLQQRGLRVKGQGLFGIVQGGEYRELREEGARVIGSLGFDGFGIGGSFGSSYGDSKKNMINVLEWVVPLLPEEKPKHLLGIGHLDDLEKAIKKGIDLFDCVYPTRFARHGVAITSRGNLVVAKTQFLKDKAPLDKRCGCFVCQNYSQAYLSHLFRAQELTALRLLTYHNLWFFREFVDTIREKIASGKI